MLQESETTTNQETSQGITSELPTNPTNTEQSHPTTLTTLVQESTIADFNSTAVDIDMNTNSDHDQTTSYFESSGNSEWTHITG